MTQYPNQPVGNSSSGSPLGGFDTARIKRNALIACIVGFVCGGVIPGILGLLGYLKGDTEPATAKKFTKWAWIVFAIIWILNIAWVAIAIAAGAFSGSASVRTY